MLAEVAEGETRKGAKLGNRTNLVEAQAKGVVANRAAVDALAANVLPVLRQIQASGATTLRAIAEALNKGHSHGAGGQWLAMTAPNVLARDDEAIAPRLAIGR